MRKVVTPKKPFSAFAATLRFRCRLCVISWCSKSNGFVAARGLRISACLNAGVEPFSAFSATPRLDFGTGLSGFCIHAVPPLFLARLLTPMQKRQTLQTCHRSTILRGNSFHLCPMRGFSIARIAQNHAVVIEGVHLVLLSAISGHIPYPGRSQVISGCLGETMGEN